MVYVDDRCSTPYSCDYLLNYNIFSRINDYTKLYSTKKSPVYMLGTKYAPLRKEFENCCKRDTSQKAKNIFVSTGGADAEHFTVDMVKKAAEKTEYCFHIVVGRMNRDNKLLSEKAEQIGNIIIHENVESMAELMCSCEVAISAAGSTLYELCATQTPSITYVLADNQIPAAEEFDSRKIIRNCGDIRDLGKRILAENLIEEAIALAENYDERKRLSEQMGYIVDGKGTSRILEQVLHI